MKFLGATAVVALALLTASTALVLTAGAASALPPGGPPSACIPDQNYVVSGRTISAYHFRICPGAEEPDPC